METKLLDWRVATKMLRSHRQKLYQKKIKGGRGIKVRDVDVAYSTALFALKRAIEEVEKSFKQIKKIEGRFEIRFDKETDSPYLYAVRDHSAGRNRLGGNR